MSFSNFVTNFNRLYVPFKQWYSNINPANMSGAIDVIVVQQPDGSYLSSPFHVRFGKYRVLRAKEKIVYIEVNGEPVSIYMKLDDNGTAYFVEEVDSDEADEEFNRGLATSPIPSENEIWRAVVEELNTETETEVHSFAVKAEENSEIEQKPEPRQSIAVQTEPAPKPKFVRKSRSKKDGTRHSRNNSKTSFKDFQIESTETTEDEELRQIFSSAADDCHEDEADRVPEPDSFVLSRLPDKRKLDSIFETQSKQNKLSVEIESAYHYYSEPDMTPANTPVNSRPSSPVLSDSEWEVSQQRSSSGANQQKEEQSWPWGEFPTSTAKQDSNEINLQSATIQESEDESAPGWGISYLWRGRKKSQKEQKYHKDDEPGIFLDDLNEHDDEKLQIYVGSPRSYTRIRRSASGSSTGPAQFPLPSDEDAESGKGPSLPISPRTVEGGLIPGESSFRAILPDIDISLCGGLESDPPAFSALLFEQSKVTFDDYVLRLQNPEMALFESPALVVRIGEQYYTWKAALPIIMSRILYGRPLPSDLVEIIRGSYQEPKLEKAKSDSPPRSTMQKKTSSSWWPFGSARKEDEGENTRAGIPESSTIPGPSPVASSTTPDPSPAASAEPESSKNSIAVQTVVTEEVQFTLEEDGSPVEEEKTPVEEESTPVEEEKTIVEGSTTPVQGLVVDEGLPEMTPNRRGKKYRKTLRLWSDAIKLLNLKPGSNEACFTVTTAMQGTGECSCHIYLWKWSDRVVISDIDGTITKSDVLGHILPRLGHDWAQSGVASLFARIKSNGYHIAYLSARAISQADDTKDYLTSIRQGNINLPDGPLLLNPTSLFGAFHREVIEKKPEEFKIACLNDIKSLFPSNHNPFYAGYGNRTNDVIAYTAIGIPRSRIFTINHKGELKLESVNYTTSYPDQSTIADLLFPPYNNSTTKLRPDFNPYDEMEYSNFAFWREPVRDVDESLKVPSRDQSKSRSPSQSNH